VQRCPVPAGPEGVPGAGTLFGPRPFRNVGNRLKIKGMEPIEAYTDYRKFLKDYYEDRKQRTPSFSHRQFCNKAGLGSPSFLREVIDGKRNITDATLPAFQKALGLGEVGTAFFAAMVRFNQTTDPVMKRSFLEAMRGLRKKVPVALVALDAYEYYSTWYLPVLRELAVQRDWADDWAALAKAVRPRIRKSQVREGLELLEKLGFLRRNGSRWEQADPSISTGGEVDSQAVRSANREYARLGMESIESFPPSRRDVSSLLMGVPASAFPKIKQEIREFKDRLVRLAQESETPIDRVYAMNLQFFPIGLLDAEEEP
jgi:uncharacterized protein (TIGR02147 family)